MALPNVTLGGVFRYPPIPAKPAFQGVGSVSSGSVNATGRSIMSPFPISMQISIGYLQFGKSAGIGKILGLACYVNR
jgi:hypothetical protein